MYKFLKLLPKDYYLIPDNDAKNLLRPILMKICVCPFCKLDSLKKFIRLDHCKCTDRTSNKSGFLLSPDIVPTRIDEELQNQLLKILTI